MPKSNQDLMKRTLAQAFINIDWAGAQIHEVAEKFRPVHPDLAEGLDAAMSLLVTCQEVMNTFAGACWLNDHPDWSSWSATGRPRHDVTEVLVMDSEVLGKLLFAIKHDIPTPTIEEWSPERILIVAEYAIAVFMDMWDYEITIPDKPKELE